MEDIRSPEPRRYHPVASHFIFLLGVGLGPSAYAVFEGWWCFLIPLDKI